MSVAPLPGTIRSCPSRDTVLYDGQCRFCRGQIAVLRWLDVGRVLEFVSLHDPSVSRDFPELPPERMLEEMVVVDRRGRVRGGASAVRYLSRRLVALWPAMLPLHVPGTLPFWSRLYGFVARNRHRIAGRCDDGGCRIR